MAKIPEFKTKKEEKEFWAAHSSADYWDDTEERDDAYVKPRLESISLKIDPGLLNKARVIANKRGLSYNAMIRYILSKGIDRELKDL